MNRTATAIFLALLCTGCPKRVDFGPAGPLTDAQEVLRLVRQAQSHVISLQGEARLRVESPQGAGTVSAWVALMRPGKLRLELTDFFNRPVASLTTDGERFGLYQVQQGLYYRGPATVGNLSQLLPVALPPEELVSVMLGQAPLLPTEQVSLQVDTQQGLYLLTLRRGELTQVLHVHPTSFRVVRSQVGGASTYLLEYGDFHDHGSWVLPHSVELRAEAAGTRLHLRYTEATLNEVLEPSTFDLAAPPDVREVEVDPQGRELPSLELPPPPPGGEGATPVSEGGGGGNLG